MSETPETQSQVVNMDPIRVDLRAELKRGLADEFETALSSEKGLTTELRKRLVGLVRDEQVTTENILKVMSADE